MRKNLFSSFSFFCGVFPYCNPSMVHYPYAMRICNNTLQELREKGLRVPGYDRNRLRTRIAHIGLGHFHRAHFLSYLERLLNSNLTDSGVFEINIVPADPSFIGNLRKQDYMYSLLTLAPDGTEERPPGPEGIRELPRGPFRPNKPAYHTDDYAVRHLVR